MTSHQAIVLLLVLPATLQAVQYQRNTDTTTPFLRINGNRTQAHFSLADTAGGLSSCTTAKECGECLSLDNCYWCFTNTSSATDPNLGQCHINTHSTLLPVGAQCASLQASRTLTCRLAVSTMLISTLLLALSLAACCCCWCMRQSSCCRSLRLAQESDERRFDEELRERRERSANEREGRQRQADEMRQKYRLPSALGGSSNNERGYRRMQETTSV